MIIVQSIIYHQDIVLLVSHIFRYFKDNVCPLWILFVLNFKVQFVRNVLKIIILDKIKDVYKLILYVELIIKMMDNVSHVLMDIFFKMEYARKLLKKWILIVIISMVRNVLDVLGDIDLILKVFVFNLTIFVDFIILQHINVNSVILDLWLVKIKGVVLSLSQDV